LSLFDPIWEVLFPAERMRVIRLLIRQVSLNGKSGPVEITWWPEGIGSLAEDLGKEECHTNTQQ